MNSSVVSVVLKCTFYDNVQLKAHLTDVQGIWIVPCTDKILFKRLISRNGTLKHVRLFLSAKDKNYCCTKFLDGDISNDDNVCLLKIKAPYGVYNIVIACPLYWPFLAGAFEGTLRSHKHGGSFTNRAAMKRWYINYLWKCGFCNL